MLKTSSGFIMENIKSLEEAIQILKSTGLKASLLKENCLVVQNGQTVESYYICGGLNKVHDPNGLISFEFGFSIFELGEQNKYIASCFPPGTGQIGYDQDHPLSLEENINWIISKYKDFHKMNNVFYKGKFYALTDFNLQAGAVLFGKELYLFNPASLQVAPITYNGAVDWIKLTPKHGVPDISDLRYHESLRPVITCELENG